MKSLGQYSDQEFIELVQEAGQLSYMDKVKLGFEEFGTVRGTEERTIEGEVYTFSLVPDTIEENIERWQFYFDQKKDSEYEEYSSWIISMIQNSLKKEEAIKVRINELKQEREEGKKNWGYKIFAHGHKVSYFINCQILSKDYTEEVQYCIDGYMNGRLESELNDMLEESKEPESSESSQWIYRNKLAFLYELGIFDFLQERYKLGNENLKFAKLLQPLLGECKGNEVGKLLNHESNSRSALNPTIKKEIKKHLIQLGLSEKLKSES